MEAAGATGEKRAPPVITIARSRLIKAGAALFLGGAGVGAAVVYAALPPPAAAPGVFVRAEVETAAPDRAETAAARLAVADTVVNAGPAANAGPPAAVAVAATAPPRAPSRRAAPPSGHDTTGESALLSSAGLALSDGKATEALGLLALHERNYPRSPRAPQREMLAIQALVQAGRRADAAARAERFRAAFPHAMVLPAIEAVLNGR